MLQKGDGEMSDPTKAEIEKARKVSGGTCRCGDGCKPCAACQRMWDMSTALAEAREEAHLDGAQEMLGWVRDSLKHWGETVCDSLVGATVKALIDAADSAGFARGVETVAQWHEREAVRQEREQGMSPNHYLRYQLAGKLHALYAKGARKLARREGGDRG